MEQGVKTACIAFAGFSARDVKAFADRCQVAALDGAYDPSSDSLVFCDLEQTKGYEFETLIIVQCKDRVLPPHDSLEEERYRYACHLYVAMTRAKRELILSFHDKLSPWITQVGSTIGTAFWSDVENLDEALLQGVPDLLPEAENRDVVDVGRLTGLQFLFTPFALGLSVEAQDKISELVDGRGGIAAGSGRRLKWQNMDLLITDLTESRRHDPLFGPTVAAELRELKWRVSHSAL
jgi:UvrD-like helicase C-terminal domain